MSWIWNVMLSCGSQEFWQDGEDEALEIPHAVTNINAWLEADTARNYGPLTDLAQSVGGAGMSASLYGGGFKHFDIEGFLTVVATQDWQDFQSVQLWVQGENDDTWTPIDFAENADQNAT